MAAIDSVAQVRLPYQPNRITADFRPSTDALWITMNRDPEGGCQNFTLPLLDGMRTLLQSLQQDRAMWRHNGEQKPVHYAVLKSGHPDYFSLGGDLAHFRSCIEARDNSALFQYSKLCLDMMYEWATALNGRTTTIALVQGRALGGGFEAALSADFLIAEEHSEFGFPEIMFGLFPCTGGMSLLARRIGVNRAEDMMTSGRLYSAAELKEMGVVDAVCPRGEGEIAVDSFISEHAKRRVPRLMLQRSRHRVAPLDYEELLTVVEEWTEVAMALTGEELRVMEMLIRLQQGTRQAA